MELDGVESEGPVGHPRAFLADGWMDGSGAETRGLEALGECGA